MMRIFSNSRKLVVATSMTYSHSNINEIWRDQTLTKEKMAVMMNMLEGREAHPIVIYNLKSRRFLVKMVGKETAWTDLVCWIGQAMDARRRDTLCYCRMARHKSLKSKNPLNRSSEGLVI